MQTDNKEKLLYSELTYKIIGILYKVHNKLGPTYKEKHYQRAVEEELREAGIPFEKEKPVTIGYDNKKVGKYFLDFFINGRVVLEIKAINRLHPKYFDQVLSYMNTLQARIGLIANFKKDRLELKRLILPDRYLKPSV